MEELLYQTNFLRNYSKRSGSYTTELQNSMKNFTSIIKVIKYSSLTYFKILGFNKIENME
jgi:hypothetical protein